LHHSFHLDLYEKLREKLNKAPIGMPSSHSGAEKEILRLLFTEEEAVLALHMPFVNFTVEQLAEKTGKSAEYLEKVLNEMARKGTVWKGVKDGKVVYRLFPVMVGLFEMHFLSGPGKDPLQERLAPLMAKYIKEAFLKELGDREHPIMRAIPERDAISPKARILPYEDAVKLVREHDYHALGYCGCRIISRLMGEGCRRYLESCLHFGSLARYMVEHGFARRITADEAMEVLKRANREGLVHVAERSQGPIYTICNCCDDCCIFFRAIHEAKYPRTIACSSYVASVDTSRCIACGICVIRCPMRAVVVKKNREPAKVSAEKCLGCGVCVPTCPVGAIELVLRDELLEVPDRRTFALQLLRDRGKDLSDLF